MGQHAQVEYRPLTQDDVSAIKARTAEGRVYGMLPADVAFTWQELRQPK